MHRAAQSLLILLTLLVASCSAFQEHKVYDRNCSIKCKLCTDLDLDCDVNATNRNKGSSEGTLSGPTVGG